MKNLKLKIIVGFRKEQSYTIEADEAHKAYYLFLNPEQRGVFSNGVALIGGDIKFIEPDYNATMGWNPTHVLDGDDWNEIRSAHVDKKLQLLMSQAKEIASDRPELIGKPMTSLVELPISNKTYTQGLTSLGDILKKDDQA